MKILSKTLLLMLTLSASNAYAAALTYRDSNPTLGGYDVVAYFAESRAEPGNKAISYVWGGKTWRFSSKANKHRFIQNPEAYAPRYDGVCAYAVSQNAIAPIDPEAWTIVNGELYFNNSLDVRERWQKNHAEYIKQGDAKWVKLSQ